MPEKKRYRIVGGLETRFEGKTVRRVDIGQYEATITFTDGSTLEISTSLPGPDGELSMLLVGTREPSR